MTSYLASDSLKLESYPDKAKPLVRTGQKAAGLEIKMAEHAEGLDTLVWLGFYADLLMTPLKAIKGGDEMSKGGTQICFVKQMEESSYSEIISNYINRRII